MFSWLVGDKAVDKFSLEQLRRHTTTLEANKRVTPENKETLVEVLRSISEIIIWGDQHNEKLFDFFMEKNVLGFFIIILEQDCGNSIKVQLLQTLSIMIENLSNDTSVYFLLSNNHMNKLITHPWDFDDEEVLAYYISFLKAMALKLNTSTIQFYFSHDKAKVLSPLTLKQVTARQDLDPEQADQGQDGKTSTKLTPKRPESVMPLYSEAVQFFAHPESMIRISVRTLTLAVYNVPDEDLRAWVVNDPYLAGRLVQYIRDQSLLLDVILRASSHFNHSRLDAVYADLLDQFYYIADIYELGVPTLNEALTERLLKYLIIPLYIRSLDPDSDAAYTTDPIPRISQTLALFLLAALFHIFRASDLLDSLTSILMHPDHEGIPNHFILPPFSDVIATALDRISAGHISTPPTPQGSPPKPTLQVPKGGQGSGALAGSNLADAAGGVSPRKKAADVVLDSAFIIPSSPIHIQRMDRSTYRHVLLSFLSSSYERDRRVLGTLCLFYAIVKNDRVSKELLAASDLYPQHLAKSRKLMDVLMTTPTTTTVSDTPKTARSLENTSKATRLSSISAFSSDGLDDSAEERGEGEDDIPAQTNDPAPLFSTSESPVTRVKKTLFGSTTAAGGVPLERGSSLTSMGSVYVDALPADGYSSSDIDLAALLAEPDYAPQIIEPLLSVLSAGSLTTITLQMAGALLLQLVVVEDAPRCLKKAHMNIVADAYELACQGLRERLQTGAAVEEGSEFFLDLFEDEFRCVTPVRASSVITDPMLLMPLTETPLTGMPLAKRLPSGEVEQARLHMQRFFVLRALRCTLLAQPESLLPLNIPRVGGGSLRVPERDSRGAALPNRAGGSGAVKIGERLDLTNQDLIGFTMTAPGTGRRVTRYLVVDTTQMIFVEPDQKHIGWAHVTAVAPLQNLEVTMDKSDSRLLHVTSSPLHMPVTSWKLLFDDRIRAIAARQTLVKGRTVARNRKMRRVYELIGLQDPRMVERLGTPTPPAPSGRKTVRPRR